MILHLSIWYNESYLITYLIYHLTKSSFKKLDFLELIIHACYRNVRKVLHANHCGGGNIWVWASIFGIS